MLIAAGGGCSISRDQEGEKKCVCVCVLNLKAQVLATSTCDTPPFTDSMPSRNCSTGWEPSVETQGPVRAPHIQITAGMLQADPGKSVDPKILGKGRAISCEGRTISCIPFYTFFFKH